jgi:hypothetical protein
MKKTPFQFFWHLAGAVFILLSSCSHKYDPDKLDLAFYQWNLWYDTGAESGQRGPSCGWEDLHRGMGELVRIPALAADHFPEKQEQGVLWFHCRFTLPENWEDRKIHLQITGAAPETKLFLNEELIADFTDEVAVFELDVSDRIFYTRDNHLALKILTAPGMEWNGEGISGGVVVKSIPAEGQISEDQE